MRQSRNLNHDLPAVEDQFKQVQHKYAENKYQLQYYDAMLNVNFTKHKQYNTYTIWLYSYDSNEKETFQDGTTSSITGDLVTQVLPLFKGHAKGHIISGNGVSCGLQCSALSLGQTPAQCSCSLLSLLGILGPYIQCFCCIKDCQ